MSSGTPGGSGTEGGEVGDILKQAGDLVEGRPVGLVRHQVVQLAQQGKHEDDSVAHLARVDQGIGAADEFGFRADLIEHLVCDLPAAAVEVGLGQAAPQALDDRLVTIGKLLRR